VDVKYGSTGAGDRFYPISGTSMASPQVAGIAACLASGKERFTNADLRGFLDRWSMRIMDFDTAVAGVSLPGTGAAQTYDITTTSPSYSYYTLSGNDRNGSVSGNNVTVTVVAGDTINFNLSNVDSVHPFYIRDASGGTNVSNPTANNQGGTGNVTVSWTPSAAGTYSYICGNHLSMKGTITVEPFVAGGIQAGSFGDYTCSKDSKNKTLRYGQDKWLGKNGVSVSGAGTNGAEGVAREIKGERLSEKVTNQTFPRRNTLFRSWDHN
jgi:plastocyanin